MNTLTESRKLHIGCFDCPIDGWVNTDITPHIRISRIPYLAELLFRLGKIDERRMSQHRAGVFKKVAFLDLMRPFPYRAQSFDYVFSSHVFEHIPSGRIPGLLAEILRVLAPGGVMRVSVPDLSYFVSHYTPEGADEFVKAVFEISQAGGKNRHHWMYSHITLQRALSKAGFVNVRQCGFRDGKCADLAILDNRPEHSLFVEGEKPAPTQSKGSTTK